MTKLHHSASLRLLVALFSFVLIAGACVSTEDEDAGTTDGASTTTDDSTDDDTVAADSSDDDTVADDSSDDAAEEPVALTASWRGVTEDTIYVGVSLLDFELLVELGLGDVLVAVERNEEIVPRGQHQAMELADGDRLEVVHFVGGG